MGVESVVLLGNLETERYRAGDCPIKISFGAVFLGGDPQVHTQAPHIVGQSFHPPADLGHVLVKF